MSQFLSRLLSQRWQLPPALILFPSHPKRYDCAIAVTPLELGSTSLGTRCESYWRDRRTSFALSKMFVRSTGTDICISPACHTMRAAPASGSGAVLLLLTVLCWPCNSMLSWLIDFKIINIKNQVGARAQVKINTE